MNHNTLTKELLLELKDRCFSSNNHFGKNIYQHHMLPVIEYADLMAEALEADKEIVEIGAILHDYASVKDYALYPDHQIHGQEEAEKLLKQYEYPQEKIDHVKACIYEHRGSVRVKQMSKESICVASGDAMAHIANVASLLHLAYTRKGMDVDEGKVWVKGKIDRSWNKLCSEAQEIIKVKYDSAVELLS